MPYRRIDAPRPPLNMEKLPRDFRGLPIPAFVAWVGDQPDFRLPDQMQMARMVLTKSCFICGNPLKSGQEQRDREGAAFIIGPVAALTRKTGEPPCHLSCAIYAASVCPFMLDPTRHRRENNLPADVIPPLHILMERNPGVMLVWVTDDWRHEQTSDGYLFHLGAPLQILWYTRGREATRVEVMAAFSMSMPFLHRNFTNVEEVARMEREWYETVKPLIPAPHPKAKRTLTWTGGGVLVACLPAEVDRMAVLKVTAPTFGLDPDTVAPEDEAGCIVGVDWHEEYLTIATRQLCDRCRAAIAVAPATLAITLERHRRVGIFCHRCFPDVAREYEAPENTP